MLSQSAANYKRQPAQTTRDAIDTIPVFAEGISQPVAFIRGKPPRRVLCKNIMPNHYLTKPAGAIAFAEEVLEKARALGVALVVVTDRVSGTTYRCTFEDFDRHRILVNRGHGRQWALERGRWSIDGAMPLLQAQEEAQQAKHLQLSLFEATA